MNNSPYKNHRTIIIRSLMFLGFLFTGLPSWAQSSGSTKIHFGLIYPISSNGANAPRDTNNISIHLLAGVSSVENGPSFAGLSNIVHHHAYGPQFAGFSNHVGGKAVGPLFAGFTNIYGEGKSAAFAGFANIARGEVKGSQFAGFANISKKLKGAQFAGFANIATDGSASQFAGFINVAKDVKGTQISGFINVAKKVKGAQIAGFINIADSSDCPIGILNFVKNGEKSLGLSIDETQTTMLTFRSGGKVLYGILGIGYNLKNSSEVYAAEAGLGAHIFPSNKFRINVEITAGTLENFKAGEYFKSSFKVLPALKLGKHLEIFGGPSFNYTSTNTTEGKLLHKQSLHSWQNKWSDHLQRLYIGYGGGINFIF